MNELLSYTVQYEEDEASTWYTILPILLISGQVYVMYFYDKSYFYGFDYKKSL
jgi:hypothetical protein